MNVKYFVLGFFSAVIFLLFVIGAYQFGRMSTKNEEVIEKTSQAVLSQPSATTIPTVSYSDIAQKVENSVKLKNYAALKSIMEKRVFVTIYQSECCGEIPTQEAIDNLEYLDDAQLWSFEGNAQVVKDLTSTFPENFGGAIIGLSSNGFVATFQLSDQNLISRIFVAQDYKTLISN